MFSFMAKDKNIRDKKIIEKVHNFIIEEEFESDTMIDDINIYNFFQSNFYHKFGGDLKIYDSINIFMTQYHR